MDGEEDGEQEEDGGRDECEGNGSVKQVPRGGKGVVDQLVRHMTANELSEEMKFLDMGRSRDTRGITNELKDIRLFSAAKSFKSDSRRHCDLRNDLRRHMRLV